MSFFWRAKSAFLDFATRLHDKDITVMAFPAEASALDFVLPMLKAGKNAEAVPYLES